LHAQFPEPQPFMVLDIFVSYAAFCAGVRGSPKSSGK
jgi:hypothetical protein